VDPGAAQRARAARSGSGAAPSTSPATPPVTPPAPAPSEAAGAQPGQGQTGRGAAPAAIPPRRVDLRNLETGTVRSWQDIGTFTFAPTSTHLVLRRRGAETAGPTGTRGGGPGAPAAGAAAATASGAGPRGLDAVLLDLRTAGHQLLGSVGDFAFNRSGELLAFTVDAAVKDGNGVFVFDTRNGRVTPLDNDAKSYSRLAWNDDGTAIAVLKGSEVEKMREKNNVLVAFPDIGGALKDGASVAVPVVLDPAKTDSFPKGWVASDRAALAWSEDNKRVFFGIKEQVPAPDTARKSTDETADVDVWNTGDERVQSLQMVRAEQDRNFTFRQAFDISAKRFIKLADETMRELDVAPDGKWAMGFDTHAYIRNEKILPTADRPPHVRHHPPRPAFPLLEGQQDPGLRLRSGDNEDPRRRKGELRRY